MCHEILYFQAFDLFVFVLDQSPGIAFIIATFFINEGMVRLEKKKGIPNSFKGTAIVFLYMGIIAMAFTGFAGKSVFF